MREKKNQEVAAPLAFLITQHGLAIGLEGPTTGPGMTTSDRLAADASARDRGLFVTTGTDAPHQGAPRLHGPVSVQSGRNTPWFEDTERLSAIPLHPIEWQGMATRRARKKRSPGSQKTGVLGLLEWMRWELPYFSDVILRDYSEDDARVEVFVVFNNILAQAFSKGMESRLKRAVEHLGEERQVALRTLLHEVLVEGPKLLDVELTLLDYGSEEPGDFDNTHSPKDLPAGAFLYFELQRKKVEKKGATTATGHDPASDAGAPRYVVRDPDAPIWAKGDADTETYLDPDWSGWVPNPLKSKGKESTENDRVEAAKLAALLDATCQGIRPTWPSWASLAKDLRDAGHTLMDNVPITPSGVRRVVIASELLLGNKKPDILV